MSPLWPDYWLQWVLGTNTPLTVPETAAFVQPPAVDFEGRLTGLHHIASLRDVMQGGIAGPLAGPAQGCWPAGCSARSADGV